MKVPLRAAAAALAVVASLVLAACGSAPGAGSGGSTLSISGFSVARLPNNAIEKKFARTADGNGVRWKETYGASGDQSRAVEAGSDADYVHYSLEGDVTRLVKADLVDEDWDKGPNKGIVSRSVVVLVVRKGNPKKIEGWDDLVKDGIGIVSPNPGSSGSARWNILAAYGQVIAEGGSKKDAEAYLTKFFENAVALPGSAREATTAFLAGTGDVLLSYENEAILSRQQDEDLDYVVPDSTLLIENPGAILKDANPKASAWLDYVLSRDGQVEFVKLGFRPVIDGLEATTVEGANDPSDPFPIPENLLTVGEDFGGWSKANDTFFDEDKGLVPAIQKATGKS